jgi:hypothetical protein
VSPFAERIGLTLEVFLCHESLMVGGKVSALENGRFFARDRNGLSAVLVPAPRLSLLSQWDSEERKLSSRTTGGLGR